MKKIAPYLVLVFLLSACFKKEKQANFAVIPDKYLIPIMVDVHLAEAMIRTNNIPPQYKNDTVFFDSIFKKHGYTRAILDSTLSFYIKEDPKKFEIITEKLVEELNKIDSKALDTTKTVTVK